MDAQQETQQVVVRMGAGRIHHGTIGRPGTHPKLCCQVSAAPSDANQLNEGNNKDGRIHQPLVETLALKGTRGDQGVHARLIMVMHDGTRP